MMRPRVVLAEDHPAMAAALQKLLEEDYEVIGVAADAVGLVEITTETVPDLIVSDIGMPKGGGFTAAAVILARRPDARIVFVTGESDPGMIRTALELGARGYVLKGDAGDELVTAARSVIEGAHFLSSNARRSLGWPANQDD